MAVNTTFDTTAGGTASTAYVTVAICDSFITEVIPRSGNKDLSKCWVYHSSAYTDRTSEANSSGGTAFNTIETAAVDFLYIGHNEPFTAVYFDLATVGSYGALTIGYSKADGTWGTAVIKLDGTAGLTQDGWLVFNLPSDFAPYAVNSFGAYWLRISAASVTTTATCNQLRIGGTDWIGLGTNEKQRYIMAATHDIDTLPFIGKKYYVQEEGQANYQALQWPREYQSSLYIPREVQEACAYQAMYIFENKGKHQGAAEMGNQGLDISGGGMNITVKQRAYSLVCAEAKTLLAKWISRAINFQSVD